MINVFLSDYFRFRNLVEKIGAIKRRNPKISFKQVFLIVSLIKL